MDGPAFDRIAVLLASGHSRRTVVKTLAGGIAGGVVALLGGTAGAAPRCKREGQACQTSADCCPGNLGNGNVHCASNGKKNKTCQPCPVGTVACNGGCVDLGTDVNNCGTCGRVCFGGTNCVNGTCQCPAGKILCADNACHECCPGETKCNGACVNLNTDKANCGACGTACPAGQACDAGECKCINNLSCPYPRCFCEATDENLCVSGEVAFCGDVCSHLNPCTGSREICMADPNACGDDELRCIVLAECPDP